LVSYYFICGLGIIQKARLRPWASEYFFSRSSIVDFLTDSQKDFSRGENSGEISFYPLETKRAMFLLKI